MTQVIPVVFDAAEGDTTQAVDFQSVLYAGWRGRDVNVGFFACANLLAG